MDWLNSLAPMMRGVAASIVPQSDIDDVVQDAFVKLLMWERAKGLGADGDNGGLATNMVRQSALDSIRKSRAKKRGSGRVISLNEPITAEADRITPRQDSKFAPSTPFDDAVGSEVINLIQRELEGLPERWAKSLGEYLFGGGKPETAAERAVLDRGKRALRAKLTERGVAI